MRQAAKKLMRANFTDMAEAGQMKGAYEWGGYAVELERLKVELPGVDHKPVHETCKYSKMADPRWDKAAFESWASHHAPFHSAPPPQGLRS